ncbi:MAG: hypothetical protein JRH16_07120 [Deltaproteobacteria bacterium]|nr:hypothetical protein [Deltaproteobacteria bacterium]MBW2360632.1 hypothetical protein [Deltaproteobacteria bacterium]
MPARVGVCYGLARKGDRVGGFTVGNVACLWAGAEPRFFDGFLVDSAAVASLG